jgi:hypothetical protein
VLVHFDDLAGGDNGQIQAGGWVFGQLGCNDLGPAHQLDGQAKISRRPNRGMDCRRRGVVTAHGIQSNFHAGLPVKLAGL